MWQSEIDAQPALIEHYDRNLELNLAIIRRFIKALGRSERVSFLLLAAPINPRWHEEPGGEEFHTRYLEDLRRFALENDMPFLNINEGSELTGDDFVDYEGHIGNRAARHRCTEVLASHVSQRLATTSAVSEKDR